MRDWIDEDKTAEPNNVAGKSSIRIYNKYVYKICRNMEESVAEAVVYNIIENDPVLKYCRSVPEKFGFILGREDTNGPEME